MHLCTLYTTYERFNNRLVCLSCKSVKEYIGRDNEVSGEVEGTGRRAYIVTFVATIRGNTCDIALLTPLEARCPGAKPPRSNLAWPLITDLFL